MSERIIKDLDKLRRDIGNLDVEITNFRESLENLQELHQFYQTLATLVQNKFIGLNEKLRVLIEENKNSLNETITSTTSTEKKLIDEWTVTQTEFVGSKLDSTKAELAKLQDAIITLLTESKTNFDDYSESFSSKISTALGSHEKDLERLANNQVNAFRKAVDDVKENARQIKATNLSSFQKNTTDMRKQLETNINIAENIMQESIEHMRAEYGDKLTENMESIFESFNRIKSELGQLVSNAVQRIQAELSGVTDTMDKYLVDEIAKIQDVLAEYEKGMIDVNDVALSNFNTSKESMLTTYDDITKKQYNTKDSELTEFETSFNETVDGILVNLSEQSDVVKTEIKDYVANEQSDLNNHFENILGDLSQKIDTIQKDTTKLVNDKTVTIEEDAVTLKTSIERTTQQISSQIDSAQKDASTAVVSLASSARSTISETQNSTISDLETEAKNRIKGAEQAEKMKKDVIGKIEKLERTLEILKNELGS